MIAIPHRKLWTPWDLPSRRDWLRRLKSPWVNPAAGDRLLDSNGNRMLDSSGNLMLDGGTATCCLYQARDCATNTLQSLYVKKSQFPSFPSTYYFKYSGSCYSVSSADKAACSATPVVSGQTTVASCSDAACSGTGPAPCTCPSGLASSYTISTAGVACCTSGVGGSSCASSTATAWGGAVHTGSSAWAPGYSCIYGLSVSETWSISGCALNDIYTFLALNTTSPCYWYLQIVCTGNGAKLWSGTKSTGSDPKGTYSFSYADCGISGPATLTVGP